jgi:hypothetical protein
VRTASTHRGPWPKVSVWHGTSDAIVKSSNGEDIIRQWTNVHGLPETPTHRESTGSHTRRIWNDAAGETLIEAFSIRGMGHGVPLAITTREETCGAPGAFFLDVGISSTHQIARFWCLHGSPVEMPRAAAPASVPVHIPTDVRAFAIAGAGRGGPYRSTKASFPDGKERQPRYALDPGAVIAAAFKAAGLPVAKNPAVPPGVTPRVEPAPIIAAALKAAGLPQS